METTRTLASAETQVTTTFESDREVVTMAPPSACSLPGAIANVSSIPFSQDLKSFLGKWVQIGTGTLNAASNGQIGSWDFPEVLFSEFIFQDKLQGFQGIKGTILVKVLINGTNYQQGRLMLVFHPQAQVTGVNAISRLQHLTSITQLPHVEIDVSCDSEAIIEIPYISNTLFYNLFTGVGPWGRAYLWVYSPLLTGAGSADCSYAIWACFDPKTVELYNPAKGTIATVAYKPQMKARSRKPRRRGWENAGRPPGDVEAEGEMDGPISGALNLTSKVASTMSLIPSLSALAAPVSWAAGVGGKLASAFGFSAPLDQSATAKHERRFGMGWNNCDQPDRSQVVGITSVNAVEMLPCTGVTDDDEMAFDFMVTRKAYYTKFDWLETNAVGDLLFSTVLRPIQWQSSAGTGAGTVAWRSPLAQLGTMFRMWRGDHVLTFKLVKTDLHTGRLMVVYYPGLASAPATFSDNVYCHRAVIDISCGSEFEYTFPFVLERPYATKSESIGLVAIYVVNALKFPDLVANKITTLVEVSGAPGFEFAAHEGDPWYPAYITVSPSLTYLGPPEENVDSKGKAPASLKQKPIKFIEAAALPPVREVEVYHPQMLVSTKVPSAADRDACAIKSEKIGGATRRAPSLDPAKVCIGERLTSVRQLIQRNCGAKATPSGDDIIRPFSVGLAKFDGTNVVMPDFSYDEYSRWANFFMYYRGGVRLKMVCGNSATLYRCRLRWGIGGAPIVASAAGQPLLAGPAWLMEHGTMGSGCLQVQVPGILGLTARIVRPNYTGFNTPNDIYDTASLGIQMTGVVLPSFATIMRQGAEDMQFFYFLGVPPVLSAPVL